MYNCTCTGEDKVPRLRHLLEKLWREVSLLVPIHCRPHCHEPYWLHHYKYLSRNCWQVTAISLSLSLKPTFKSSQRVVLCFMTEYNKQHCKCHQIENQTKVKWVDLYPCLVFPWQWGYCWAVWEPPGIYITRSVPSGERYWCIWSQVQHCVPWSWSEHLLSIHWQEASVNKPPWGYWRALVSSFTDWWAHVHTPL